MLLTQPLYIEKIITNSRALQLVYVTDRSSSICTGFYCHVQIEEKGFIFEDLLQIYFVCLT